MNRNVHPEQEMRQEDDAYTGRFFRLFLYWILLGIAAGLGAILFYLLLEAANFVFLDWLGGYRPARPAHDPLLFGETSSAFRPWVVLLLPAVGGALCGWLTWRFAPEAAGHGTDASIEAFHHRGGQIRARIPFVKALASALTLGTGGSGGSEGPITQIGAGIGSALADRLKLEAHERRRLMAAGMAAGIAAIFRAPLAGALFAAEVFYKEMDVEHEILIPAFISSITAYSVFALAFGWDPLFAMPDFAFDNPARLLPYAVLAFVEAGAAVLFIRIFYGVHDAFGKLKAPGWIKPALGGLCVGLIGYFAPASLGTGYGFIQEALTGSIGLGFLIAVALSKMATTSFSIGSGGSGGLFGPCIVIGCALGRGVGQIAGAWFPGMDIHPGAFALVGMAGFFSAAANCPISAILFVSEITGNYKLLVPSMLVCVVAYAASRRHSIYRSQLRSRMEAPSKMGNMLTGVLKSIKVEQAMALMESKKPITISAETGLSQLIHEFAESDQACFPVTDRKGELSGVIDGEELRRVLQEVGSLDGVIAHDLSIAPVTIRMSDSLLIAVRKICQNNREELIVVDEETGRQPLGVLDRGHLLLAYNHVLFGAAEESRS